MKKFESETEYLNTVISYLPKFNGILEEWKIEKYNPFIVCKNKFLYQNKILNIEFKYNIQDNIRYTLLILYNNNCLLNLNGCAVGKLRKNHVDDLFDIFTNFIRQLNSIWCNNCDTIHKKTIGSRIESELRLYNRIFINKWIDNKIPLLVEGEENFE